jgi:ABC-type phosphate/phosphonate transport system substrate-binding protein
MYAPSAAAAETWRELFLQLARRARMPLNVIDHPAPAPIAELWVRNDKAAIFMCGLPYSRATPQPHLIAAPVPAAPEFHGQPLYWSEFVVGSQSTHRTLDDTFGGRIAFTSPESQSGFAAPLRHLIEAGDGTPLYGEVIAPQITPQGAIAAVVEGRADVAAIDAYSLQLLRRFAPEVASKVRVVARTESRPIPPLIASQPFEALTTAFLAAHQDPALHSLLADLRLSRFVQPEAGSYRQLAQEFEATLAHWRAHKLSLQVHPGFEILGGTTV